MFTFTLTSKAAVQPGHINVLRAPSGSTEEAANHWENLKLAEF